MVALPSLGVEGEEVVVAWLCGHKVMCSPLRDCLVPLIAAGLCLWSLGTQWPSLGLRRGQRLVGANVRLHKALRLSQLGRSSCQPCQH